MKSENVALPFDGGNVKTGVWSVDNNMTASGRDASVLNNVGVDGDTEDNKMCASISTMFKMGEEVTLIDMGGCPLAPSDKCESAPGGCDPYKVDLGGHWELKTTKMDEYYGTNEGTGNDLNANNNDKYAVSAV